MKRSTLINAPLCRVPRANNIDRVGWVDGYLLVVYQGKPTLYVYGPNVEEAEMHKLCNVPYPDKLLLQLRTKHNWRCAKIEGKNDDTSKN